MGRSLDHQGIQKRNAKCVGVKAYAFEELYISAIINERSLDRLQQDQQLQHRLARSNSFVLPCSQQKYHVKTKKNTITRSPTQFLSSEFPGITHEYSKSTNRYQNAL